MVTIQIYVRALLSNVISSSVASTPEKVQKSRITQVPDTNTKTKNQVDFIYFELCL